MTAALPPDGRRDNGLPSAEWGALVDLDPRLSAALLDSLAAEGVAAYVEPASDMDVYTRAHVLPSRPLDRLWVDPSRADQARGVVASEVADLTALLAEDDPAATAYGLVHPVPRTAAVRVLTPPDLPGPAKTPSDDELFKEIIAGFGQESTDPVPRWPVSEDLGSISPDVPDRPRRRRTDAQASGDDGLPDWVEPEALEDEGHYEPPPAPKVPRPRLRTLIAVVMILLGMTIVFAPYQIGLDDSTIYMLLGLLLAGGGAGLLITWMRDAPPWDSGPDDGAVV